MNQQPNKEHITESINVILEQLTKQEKFIQELKEAIKENKLEHVMTLLDDNKEFITSDFIISPTGEMVAQYLLASAIDLLLVKYPFLHLSPMPTNGKKVFYIGSWYKANTRKILYLDVNTNNNQYYSLDLDFDKEVLSEWDSMSEVKENINHQIAELETAYTNAKKSFDKKYAETLVHHKQELEKAEEELEYLTTKMLKKQSDIDEINRQIKREKAIIEQIQKEPEIYFEETERDIKKLEDAVADWKRRLTHIDLIEALVQREKNEIANHLTDYKQFIKEINELSAIFRADK